MPPVNTPTVPSPIATRSPSRPQTPNTAATTRSLTPLSYLSSPAPDLASTLYTSHAAEQADQYNVGFLRDANEYLDNPAAHAVSSSNGSSRAHIDAQRDPRRSEYNTSSSSRLAPLSRLSQSQLQQAYRDTPEDYSRRERLQRVLARLNRMHEPTTSSATAYSNRTPSPNRQSLYDWAPTAYDPEAEVEQDLEELISELRREQPDTHPDILRTLAQSLSQQQTRDRARERYEAGSSVTGSSNAADGEQRRSLLRDRERRRREGDVSLRSRAAMQRARQEGAGSPSATERMLRYVMERERSGMSEEEERARGGGWLGPNPTWSDGAPENGRLSGWDWQRPSSELRERDRQERVDAFRRGYLAESGVAPRLPRISTPSVPPVESQRKEKLNMLDHTLKYLSDLRFCDNYADSVAAAIDNNLGTKEFFSEMGDNFINNLDDLPRVQESSWLQPGAVFEGHQHAMDTGATLTHQASTASASRVEQINPNYHRSPGPTLGFDHPPGSSQISTFDPTRPWMSHHPGPTIIKTQQQPHDQWPVRVTLHTVDLDKLTIQGTMEAYDVPQNPTFLSGLASATDRPKAGKRHQPITTYLEGDIIDLHTHSFITPDNNNIGRSSSSTTSAIHHRNPAHPDNPEPYPTNVENRNPYTTIPSAPNYPSATPQSDSQNWLKLPPFSTLHGTPGDNVIKPKQPIHETMAHTLLSTGSLKGLFEQYIFMRWKEKCFVHSPDSTCTASATERMGDQDKGHGLTISGFYYVSLRRSDGVLEGLYFDPLSTPHQCLKLKGRGGGLNGVWEFR